MKNLNNLLKYSDFDKNWKAEKADKTKRTDTGLDVLKEGIDRWPFNKKDPELEREEELEKEWEMEDERTAHKAKAVDRNAHLSIKYQEDLESVLKAIKSCETNKQTESAENYFEAWRKKWNELFESPYPYYYYDDIEMIEEVLDQKFRDIDENTLKFPIP